MAKIGTAHIEIKPVIDEAALRAITEQVAAAVAAGVARGMQTPAAPYVWRPTTTPYPYSPTFPSITVTSGQLTTPDLATETTFNAGGDS